MALQNRKVLYVSPAKINMWRWKVHWEKEQSGSFFSTKEEAIRSARQLVRSYPEGYCSQIKVQRADGTFEIEWTYGKDPFPPRG